MSLKDCMLSAGFSEKEIAYMKGDDDLTEPQFVEKMVEVQELMTEKVRLAKLETVATEGALAKALKHKAGSGNGLMSLLSFDKTATSGTISVELMAEQFARETFRDMSGMMERLMPKFSNGWQVDEAFRLNIVKEIYGEATGDVEARAFAKSYTDAREALRVKHNLYGGNIVKNKNWNLPQVHVGLKVRRVSRQIWVDELLADGVLDLELMVNRDTGVPFKNAQDLRPALEAMYDSIVTNGASKMDLEAAKFRDIHVARGTKSRERFLYFKTAENYLNYQKKYGEDNIYSAIITDIKGVATDTALMKQFGPNPLAGFNYVKAKASVAAGESQRLIGRAESTMKELTGQTAGANTTLQKWAEGFRAINVFKLGSASVSAIADQGTMFVAAKMNGLSALTNTLHFLKQLTVGGKAERQFLLQSGVNADYVIDVASGMARYGDNDALSAWGKFSTVPDRFIRMSGLNKMTEAGRASIQLSALGHLANVDNLKWADLDTANLRMLGESGIDEADWKQMAKSKKQTIRGARYLDMREMPEALQIKIGNMMDVLAFRAIPAPDAEVRAIMHQGTTAGTVPGELFKSGGQFKSFGITILLYQIEYSKQFGRRGGAAYLAGTFITVSIAGLVALQIKQLLTGKEMMNMDDPRTWLAAMAQGGGMGIFTDFLFKDQSRFGASMIGTFAGPSAATLETLVQKLMLAPTQQAFVAAFNDDPDGFEKIARKYGVDLTQEVRKNLPTQLWYTKLLFDRYVFQTISQLSDPSYINKLHKREARLKKDEGRGYLFKPIDLR